MAGRRRLTATIGIAVVAITGATAVGTANARGWGGRHGRTDQLETVRFAAPTAPTAASPCTVRYVVRSQTARRFTATLSVDSSARIPNWNLSWTYGGGQTLRRVTPGRLQQNGTAVTVRGRDALRPGRALQLSLAGQPGTSATAPADVRLNGQLCRLSSTTPPPVTTSTTAPATTTTTSTPSSAPTTITTSTTMTTSVPTSSTSSSVGVVPTTSTPTTTASTTKTTTTQPTSSGGPVLGTGRIQFGKVYPGIATYYGATGAGNCMYEAGGDLMVAAMNHTDYENSQACGAYVQVTGPKGTVTVKIVDQCPECQAGHIDLSQQAFAKIANPVDGRVTISWRLLSPDLAGPIAYRFKEGSSQWWCGVQIRNHRNPVRTVEALVGGSWKQIPRQDYNYFVSADGSGCGSQLRATDIYGNQVTSTGPVPVQAGAVQSGPAQFGPPR